MHVSTITPKVCNPNPQALLGNRTYNSWSSSYTNVYPDSLSNNLGKYD